LGVGIDLCQPRNQATRSSGSNTAAEELAARDLMLVDRFDQLFASRERMGRHGVVLGVMLVGVPVAFAETV
jgi:hypothetical protein